MKKLVKIKLINWHLFSNHTINIENNVLISGENGSGKSTLLDAIQYVLTAGKPKFNNAANDTNSRDLAGYVRGKIGVEGKVNLRNNDVTTHIALEYQDENNTQIIGVVISLSENNYKREHFYQIINHHIDDTFYIKNNIINDFTSLKKTLEKKNVQFSFKDTKAEAKNLIRTGLGVEKKYFDLIPKALAFKPINDLHKFIFDFLLVEDYIQIDNLRNNIRKYRELDNILKEQKKRIIILQDIENSYIKYQKYERNLNVYKIMIDLFKRDESLLKQEKSKIIYHDNNDNISINTTTISEYEIEIQTLKREIFQIQGELSTNQSYQLIRELETKVASLKIKKNDLSKKYDILITLISNEQKLLEDLDIKENITDINNKNFLKVIDNIIDQINNNREEIFSEKTKLSNDNLQLNIKLEKNLKTLDKLRKNRFSYKKQVTELIKVLEIQLEDEYKQKIKVTPLCELIDIKEEKYRNACEGYLNSQRFDLIIEEKFFDSAAKIYQKYKKENNLYGIGIVNVKKLKEAKTNENSLASKLVCHTSSAQLYVNMLLNNIQCVEEIDKIKNYNCAITPLCMIYKNHTIRAINPKVYEQPYIGKSAIIIQIKNTELIVKEQKEEIKKFLQKIQHLQSIYNKILSSNSQEIKAQYSVVHLKEQNSEKLTIAKDKLKQLQKDSSLLSLEKQLINTENRLTTIEKLREKLLITNSILEQKNNSLIEKMSEYSIILEEQEQLLIHHQNNNVELYDVSINKLKETKITNDRLSIELEKQKMETIKLNEIIINKMQNFNIETNIGYTQSIDSIDEYLEHLYKIRDLEIIKSQDQLKITKLKCEQTFQEDFISRLREKIQTATDNIKHLNNSLKDKHFNDDTYQFVISKSKKENFKDYYEIIMSNQQYDSSDLFTQKLNEKNKIIMDELFEKLTIIDDDSKNEKIISEYIDYRNYLNYDIKIKHKNGDMTYFSKVSREKSGGETQTPFYVIIASSFEQLIKKQRNSDTGCLVLFDEAFNNMDETRIEAMMEFYNRLQIQVILSVPPGRIATIQPYVTTSLMVTKDNNYSYIGEFINGKKI